MDIRVDPVTIYQHTSTKGIKNTFLGIIVNSKVYIMPNADTLDQVENELTGKNGYSILKNLLPPSVYQSAERGGYSVYGTHYVSPAA